MNQEYQDRFPQTKPIIFNSIQESRPDPKFLFNNFERSSVFSKYPNHKIWWQCFHRSLT
jgi:hypothetical protein